MSFFNVQRVVEALTGFDRRYIIGAHCWGSLRTEKVYRRACTDPLYLIRFIPA